MKEKTKLIIIMFAITCITLLLGEFIYLKYNNKSSNSNNSKKDESNIKKTEIVLDDNEKSNYFMEDNKTDDNETKSITPTSSDDVVSYIDNVANNAVDEVENGKNESKLKNTFITLTDFIFYGGKIKGYTFKELRDEQKQKIITAWEKLDAQIESKYPNYKEKIKDKKDKTYTNIKEKITSLKENLSVKVQEKFGEDVVEEAKKDTDNLKNVTSFYKDKATEYYNKTKDKISDWYSNYKNSNE